MAYADEIKHEHENNQYSLASFLQKKDGIHCFCCYNPKISHRIIDHFMNEIIYYFIINLLFLGFFNFAIFFIFPKMLVSILICSNSEWRKAIKQSYDDKKELV